MSNTPRDGAQTPPPGAEGADAGASSDSNSIKVCVRVRPFNKREKGEKCIVTMPSPQVCRIYEDGSSCLTFNFDRCYWSHSPDNPGNPFADQPDLMNELGIELLSNALGGVSNQY